MKRSSYFIDGTPLLNRSSFRCTVFVLISRCFFLRKSTHSFLLLLGYPYLNTNFLQYQPNPLSSSLFSRPVLRTFLMENSLLPSSRSLLLIYLRLRFLMVLTYHIVFRIFPSKLYLFTLLRSWRCLFDVRKILEKDDFF